MVGIDKIEGPLPALRRIPQSLSKASEINEDAMVYGVFSEIKENTASSGIYSDWDNEGDLEKRPMNSLYKDPDHAISHVRRIAESIENKYREELRETVEFSSDGKTIHIWLHFMEEEPREAWHVYSERTHMR